MTDVSSDVTYSEQIYLDGINGGEYRNRTGVHGFAIRCVTTPPTRRPVVGALLPDHEERRKTHMRAKMRSGRCRWPGDVAHHSPNTLNE